MTDTTATGLLHHRFEFIEELGQSRQGRTFLAQDVLRGQKVAVKELSLGHVETGKAIELFEREAALLERLDHRSIPHYLPSFHFSEDGRERFFLVQEFVEGESLKERVDRGDTMEIDEGHAFIEQMLPILEYLHGLSPAVIHRDIKPSNILVDAAGKYHLIDFGAVQVVGTAGYMPPEQLTGRATAASDIYALAATTVHMITGMHPGDLPMVRMRLQYRDMVGIDAALFNVLDRMLEPDVEARLQSVEEVRQILNDPTMALVAEAQSQLSQSSRKHDLTKQDLERPWFENLMERRPLNPVPMARVAHDGSSLTVDFSVAVQPNLKKKALIIGGVGLALTILGCWTNFPLYCGLGSFLIFGGVPAVLIGGWLLTSLHEERLQINAQKVEILRGGKKPEAIKIPFTELRNCYLHVVDGASGEASKRHGEKLPPHLAEKQGIVFVDAAGQEHIYGTALVTRGVLGQKGVYDATEIRWLYELVQAQISDLSAE